MPNTKVPSVSVVMSVFNNEDDVTRAVKSILLQTLQDFEFIIIDDGSTDRTPEILDSLAESDSRIRLIHQENKGLPKALNLACALARAPFIARQDADDESAPDRLRKQFEFMNSHPDISLSGTWGLRVHPKLGPQFRYEPPTDHESLVRLLERGSNPFMHGSVIFRRKTFEAMDDGYASCVPCEDFDLWLRMSLYGKLAILPSVEYFYFAAENSIGFSTYSARFEIVKLILKSHAHRKKTRIFQSNIEHAIEKAYDERCPAPAVSAYSLAISALRQGDYEGYQKNIRTAATHRGKLAIKARIHSLIASIPGIARTYYAIRSRGTVDEFLRPVTSTDLKSISQK